MTKGKRTTFETPRTTAVVDGLIDLGAGFGDVYPAQAVLLPNGKVVWMLSNAERVARGDTDREFVEMLVPLADTIKIQEMLDAVRVIASRPVALSALDLNIASVAAGEPRPVPAVAPARTTPTPDPRYVGVPNRGEYEVLRKAEWSDGRAVRYEVRPTNSLTFVAAVVYDKASTFKEGVVCIACNGDDCAHADAVRAYRIATANGNSVADAESAR